MGCTVTGVAEWCVRFRHELVSELTKLKEEMELEAKELSPVDTGALKESLEYNLEKRGNYYRIYPVTRRFKRYWKYQEFGTVRNRARRYLRGARHTGLKVVEQRITVAFLKSLRR